MIKVNKGSKVKTLEDQTRSVWPSFFQRVRNVIEKAVSICVINLHNTKVKKLQIPNIKVSSTTVSRYMTSKGWKALP